MYTLEFFNEAKTITLNEKIVDEFIKLQNTFNKKMINRQKTLKKTNIVVDNFSVIKTLINKITLETFDDNCESLIAEYNKFENKQEISYKIIEILSTNIFYSSLYASLYSKLIETDKCFQNVLDNYKNKTQERYRTVCYIDSNINYDQFCKNNENNAKIKSMSSFFSYLLLNGNLTSDFIVENIEFLVNEIKNNRENEIIFELIENINVIISVTYNVISKHTKWDNIVSSIESMKNKTASFKHLKNKCVFKCMDILDFVNKI